jgi:peptide-methionine (S)-S-oxide reductase
MSQSLANPTSTCIFRHSRPVLFIIALLLLAGIGLRVSPSAAEDARAIPAPALDEPAGHATSEVTVLAGGCFWGVQGVFQHVDGVTNALSGYAAMELMNVSSPAACLLRRRQLDHE